MIAWATYHLDGDHLEIGLRECNGARYAYTLRTVSEMARRRRSGETMAIYALGIIDSFPVDLDDEELAELIAYEWADAQATLMGLRLDRVSRLD